MGLDTALLVRDVTAEAPPIKDGANANPPVDAKPLVDLADPSDAPVRRTSGGDSGANTSSPLAADLLPKVDVAPPALGAEAIATNAKLVHDALMRRDFTGFFASPDVQALQNILNTMNAEDRRRLEVAYQMVVDAPAGTGALRRDLHNVLGDSVDYVKTESMLHRVDGVTDDAGNARYALEIAKGDPLRGERLLRAAVATLNAEQFAHMQQDFSDRYGDFATAIASASGISAVDKTLITSFFSKGSDGRNKDDVKTATEAVLAAWETEGRRYPYRAIGYVSLLHDVIGGTSEAAQAARAELNATPAFVARFNAAFGDNKRLDPTLRKVATDIFTGGIISISTIVEGNTNTLAGFFDNPDNIGTAVSNATAGERAQFTLGRWVKEQQQASSRKPADAKEETALAFYEKINGAFTSGGNARMVSIWADQLEHGGKTLISALAETHSDGYVFGVFGSGHKTQDLMSRVENLSERDWNLLRNEETAAQYRSELKQALSNFATADETARVMALVDRKVDKGVTSYEASKTINRSLDEFLADNSDGAGVENVARALLTVSSPDAARIKTDPGLRAKLDDILKAWPNSDAEIAGSALANSLYSQIVASGAQPTLAPIDQYALKILDGSLQKLDPVARQSMVAELLGMPGIHDRMNAMVTAYEKGNLTTAGTAGDRSMYRMLAGDVPPSLMRAIIDDGDIPPGVRLAMTGGYFSWTSLQGKYEEMSRLPAEIRAAKHLSPEQRQILDAVVAQGGKADTADKLRSLVIGDGGSYRDFIDQMSKLSADDRQTVAAAYARKYDGRNLTEDLIAAAGDADHQQIARHIIAEQNWQPTLVDKVRSFVIGETTGTTYKQFESALAGLKTDQEKEALKTEYERQYPGHSFDNDFMPLVAEQDKVRYTGFLTPAPQDGRQAYFDRIDQLVQRGATMDTYLTMERATQINESMLQEYQALHQRLPQEAQTALDQFFSKAFEEYKDSKEKLAEAVVIATVVAGCIIAAPATAGMSTAALLELIPALAAAGASYRVSMMAAIEGPDFDFSRSNLAKQALRGAIEGALIAVPGLGSEGAAARMSAIPELALVEDATIAAAQQGIARVPEVLVPLRPTTIPAILPRVAETVPATGEATIPRVVATTPAVDATATTVDATAATEIEAALTKLRQAAGDAIEAVDPAKTAPIVAPVVMPSVDSVASRAAMDKIDDAVIAARNATTQADTTEATLLDPVIERNLARVDQVTQTLRAEVPPTIQAAKVGEAIEAETVEATPVEALNAAPTEVLNAAPVETVQTINAAPVATASAADIESAFARLQQVTDDIIDRFGTTTSSKTINATPAETIVADEAKETVAAVLPSIDAAGSRAAMQQIEDAAVAARAAVDEAATIEGTTLDPVIERNLARVEEVTESLRVEMPAAIEATPPKVITAAPVEAIVADEVNETAAAVLPSIDAAGSRAAMQQIEDAAVAARAAVDEAATIEGTTLDPVIERNLARVEEVTASLRAEAPAAIEATAPKIIDAAPVVDTLQSVPAVAVSSMAAVTLGSTAATALTNIATAEEIKAETVQPDPVQVVTAVDVPPVVVPPVQVVATDVVTDAGTEVTVTDVVATDVPPGPKAPDVAPSDQLLKLALVRRGEGPFQVAERILNSDGKRHDVAEVFALTRAFQAVWRDEHNGTLDMSGLPVKYPFVRSDNMGAVIAALQNPEMLAKLPSAHAAAAPQVIAALMKFDTKHATAPN